MIDGPEEAGAKRGMQKYRQIPRTQWIKIFISGKVTTLLVRQTGVDIAAIRTGAHREQRDPATRSCREILQREPTTRTYNQSLQGDPAAGTMGVLRLPCVLWHLVCTTCAVSL